MEVSRKINKSDLLKLCKKYMQDLEVEKEVRNRYDKVLSRVTKERNDLKEQVTTYDEAMNQLSGLLNCILFSLMQYLGKDEIEIDRILYDDFKALNKTIVANIDKEINKIILQVKEIETDE